MTREIKLNTDWLTGLDEQQTLDLRANFAEAQVLRKRMREVLLKRIEKRMSERMSKTGYDNPNWAYLQADASGYERAMTEVIDLIK